ncbi:hypothetical protein GCM10027030_25580 [Luteococcus sediminum]
MPAALVAMSHSPLLDFVEVPADVASDVNGAFEAARAFVKDFDPQLVVTFAPDHYNGFFYDTMPPFCVGLRGFGLGDYDTATGDLDVPTERVEELVRFVQEADIDMTMSRYMGLDHGPCSRWRSSSAGSTPSRPFRSSSTAWPAPSCRCAASVRWARPSAAGWPPATSGCC